MIKTGKIVLLVLLTLCVSGSFAADAFGLGRGGNVLYNTPEPRLRYPINDTVVLRGDEPLEFKWWNDVTMTQGFILKIYKGYNMYESGLMFKEELPASTSSFSVKSSLFKDGQVYTWSLIRVSIAGYKSDKSFISFKVTKK